LSAQDKLQTGNQLTGILENYNRVYLQRQE